MKVYAALAGVLAEQGVDTVFGVLGEANMHLLGELTQRHGIAYVAAAREDGATLMADGYAQVSGRLGIASVTNGPGITNTVTPLTEAARNGTPMLLIAGDTPAGERSAILDLQDVDQREVTRATGAGFQQVRSPGTAVADLRRAIRLAASGRPIVVNAPLDVQLAEAPPPEGGRPAPPYQRTRPDPQALDRAVGIVASRRRPVLLAGRGAVRSGAREQLRRLSERLGAPLATTLLARDYFRDDPFDLGVFGTLSTELSSRVIARSDCIFAFGASLNDFTTSHGALVEGKAVVQCDADASGIGRTTPVDAGIVGDAQIVADTVVEWLDQAEVEPASFRDDALRDQLERFSPLDEFEDESGDESVDVRAVCIALNALLPADRTLVTDAGHFAVAPLRYLHVPEPEAFVFPYKFGCVGLGLGSAVGAGFARSDRPVVAVVGDGGFMMSLAEFNTAVRYRRDLIVVVLNDRSYGAEYHKLRAAGIPSDLALFDWPDFAELASSLGGHGVTVGRMADLEVARAAVARRDRPVLLDVRIDPAVRTGFYD